MISSADRAALVAAAEETIRRGSKSFALASRLFDRTTRERAWLLYAWCRHCDDMCDGQILGHDAQPVSHPRERLALIAAETEAAARGTETGKIPFDGLRIVAAECALPRRLLHDHLAGFTMDVEGWRPADEEDLLLYCYGVAGAVGCMMALVMRVPADDEETLDRAADLGIAFQLANIARDILDDHAIGRCYLPARWLDDLDLMPKTLADVDKRDRLAGLAERLVALSARYEASGRAGAARLPFRARWAVLTAAGVYGAIGRLVVERKERAWDSRAALSRGAKSAWCVRALGQACRRQKSAGDRAGLWTRSGAGI